jgi:hypothetical protein
MTKHKRDIPQSVFDSPEGRRRIKRAVAESIAELNATPRHLLDPDNPNHLSHDLHLFGEHYGQFLARQYK